MKEIIAVYQDCVLCGDRGRKKAAFIAKRGIKLRKVSAFSDEGEKLVHEAVFEHKIKGLPFYTDGEKFSYHIESFFESKKAPEKTKKSKKKEVKKDESVSKN